MRLSLCRQSIGVGQTSWPSTTRRGRSLLPKTPGSVLQMPCRQEAFQLKLLGSSKLSMPAKLLMIPHLHQVGAAVLGVPVKPTIKQVRQDGTVIKTLQRADLWEVQTPQVHFDGI